MELAILVGGIVIGFFLSRLIMRRRLVGTLCLVQTHLNADPQPLLELDKPFDAFKDKKRIILRVEKIDTRK